MAIYYSYLNYIDADGNAHQLKGYNTTNNLYVSGQQDHYIKYYKGGRVYYIGLTSANTGRLHARINDVDYSALSLTPKTASENWNIVVRSGGQSVFYCYYSSNISGNYLGYHNFSGRITKIVSIDNINASHTYSPSLAVGNNTASTSYKTGYHSKYVYSFTVSNMTFTRSTGSGDYSNLKYVIDGTKTNPTGEFYTSAEKVASNRTTSSLTMTTKVDWELNLAKG